MAQPETLGMNPSEGGHRHTALLHAQNVRSSVINLSILSAPFKTMLGQRCLIIILRIKFLVN